MHPVSNLKKKAVELSRKNKLEHFYSLCPVGSSVLDVGVSRETAASARKKPYLNYFLKTFRYSSENYTGLGVMDLSGMDQLFPGKRFVTYDGKRFPFTDNQFEWVFSNAVIEHVGDDAAQLQFLNEMMRVGENVFFTTPNKFFPVESHTDVMFLHWNNELFYRWCEKSKTNYSRETLYLFSGHRLKNLMRFSNAQGYRIHKNKALGLPMTFTVVCS